MGRHRFGDCARIELQVVMQLHTTLANLHLHEPEDVTQMLFAGNMLYGSQPVVVSVE